MILCTLHQNWIFWYIHILHFILIFGACVIKYRSMTNCSNIWNSLQKEPPLAPAQNSTVMSVFVFVLCWICSVLYRYSQLSRQLVSEQFRRANFISKSCLEYKQSKIMTIPVLHSYQENIPKVVVMDINEVKKLLKSMSDKNF